MAKKEAQRSSVTNQTVALERSETKKLNMSALSETVGERYHCCIDSCIWRHTNDFVWIFTAPCKTFRLVC